MMRKIVNKIAKAVQLLLAAPLKLPHKALNVLRYIAVGVGILESVIEKEESPPPQDNPPPPCSGAGCRQEKGGDHEGQ